MAKIMIFFFFNLKGIGAVAVLLLMKLSQGLIISSWKLKPILNHLHYPSNSNKILNKDEVTFLRVQFSFEACLVG